MLRSVLVTILVPWLALVPVRGAGADPLRPLLEALEDKDSAKIFKGLITLPASGMGRGFRERASELFNGVSGLCYEDCDNVAQILGAGTLAQDVVKTWTGEHPLLTRLAHQRIPFQNSAGYWPYSTASLERDMEKLILETAALVRLSAKGHLGAAERCRKSIVQLSYDITSKLKLAVLQNETKAELFALLLKTGLKIGFAGLDKSSSVDELLANASVQKNLAELQNQKLFEERRRTTLDQRDRFFPFYAGFMVGVAYFLAGELVILTQTYLRPHEFLSAAQTFGTLAETAAGLGIAAATTGFQLHPATGNEYPLNTAARTCLDELRGSR